MAEQLPRTPVRNHYGVTSAKPSPQSLGLIDPRYITIFPAR
jgi:hypothetical protein